MDDNNIVDIKAVLNERGNNYGDFKDHAEVAQALKEIVLYEEGEGDSKYSAMQKEAIEMICHKLARISNGDPNYKDSWVDIAGYATLVAERI